MKIQVRFRALEPSEALRAHALRRVLFHLDRYGHELTSVLLRIGDVHGPKGGPDKRCQVTAQGRRLVRVTVESVSEDAYAAVATAVERAGRAVGRGLARVRRVRAARPFFVADLAAEPDAAPEAAALTAPGAGPATGPIALFPAPVPSPVASAPSPEAES